ncbi:unnamed protein product [Darwinula stevensoni]|uniref:Uncharacterized protein n=1 Tax=Darwinula stevensoni TaxID=69355 RepID=A0A7R9A4Y6_9CRUS|nr:unnamed protein product [Darwinula stevensoni]CAG0884358.1 unnamed protein product [Darwinula stevensoni]
MLAAIALVLAVWSLWAGALARSDLVQSDCGGILTEVSGVIQSPGYPSDYPNGADCLWDIRLAEERSITIHLDEVNLEDSAGCTADYIEILFFTGQSLLLCGNSASGDVFTGTNRVFVTFHSDAQNNAGHRFSISYDSAVTGPTTPEPGCPEGWLEFQGFCYYFDEAGAEWEDARAFCRTSAGDLASVHGREEQLFIQENSKTPTLWIGVEVTGPLDVDPWQFDFVDGSDEDYQNFWVGEEFNPLGSDGVVHLVLDRWQNDDCEQRKNFLCFAEGPGCPPGYIPMGIFYCFYVSDFALTFDEAREYCQGSEGSDLLTIGNDDWMVVQLMSVFDYEFPVPVKASQFWLGMRKTGGTWGWVDGLPIGVDRWDFGFPEDGRGDCAAAVVSSWDDVGGWDVHGFVCKTRA